VPDLAAGGLVIHYATEGVGAPLVLLHGATSTGTRDWGAQRPLLRQHFQLFMPDARGHGGTRWDVRSGWGPERLVDDLLAFVDALGLAHFRLMGLSMGGSTALAFASRYPERVEALVVVSAPAENEPARSVARRRLDADAIERDDPAWAAELAALHDPAQGSGAWRRLVAALRESLHLEAPLGPESLSRIRLPVLLAYGDRDPWVPLEQVVRLRRQLPDARLLVVPGGHVVPAERPAIFNAALLPYLRAPNGSPTTR
jgi:pimeloyl-ACP methyl ester carboxylesterase